MTHSNPHEDAGRRLEDPSGDLNEAVAALVSAVRTAAQGVLDRHGLSLVEFSLLRYCSVEQRTATELAQLLPIDGSRVSRVVAGLADRGLLRRRRLRSDRRIVMLTPSDEGLEAVAGIGGALRDLNVALTRGVSSDEMRVFLSVASRIVANHAEQRGSQA
ncbi:MAG: MarR family transcriptional regulator [Acidobacteria bacterium]|nr:MarR family transcriptional regulator [Acidobacteriota bacterium]